MKTRILLSRATTCCLLILFVTAASADAVDTYLRAEMANQRLPGVAVAVLRDGKPISVRTLGLANIELQAPVTRDTVFKIGSVSKQFIATGIMLLVRDGKVRLEDPITTYFEDAPAAWKAITLRQLLSHTSGLVRESPGFDGLKVQSDADVIRKAYEVPLQSAPGDKWAYCNLGYFILAETIHPSVRPALAAVHGRARLQATADGVDADHGHARYRAASGQRLSVPRQRAA